MFLSLYGPRTAGPYCNPPRVIIFGEAQRHQHQKLSVLSSIVTPRLASGVLDFITHDSEDVQVSGTLWVARAGSYYYLDLIYIHPSLLWMLALSCLSHLPNVLSVLFPDLAIAGTTQCVSLS